MNPLMFCRNTSGIGALVAQLDEVRPFEGRLAEQDAVVGDDPDRVPVHVGEAGHEGGAVFGLELQNRLPSTIRAITSRTS